MVDSSTGEIFEGPFLRTRYNYDRNLVSRATGEVFRKPSRAKQSFKEEVDINTIVRRFGLTGQLPTNVRVPQSGDYVETVSDYQTALNMVIEAEKAFMQLPADVRKRFGNDPQELQLFVEDKANLDEARKLGIAVPAPIPAPAPEPMLVRVVPESVPGTSST